MFRITVLIAFAVVALAGVSPSAAADPEAVILQGTLSGERFGASLDRIGDVNGDGLDDFAVGAPQGVGSGGRSGVVHLFFGRQDELPATADLILDGELSGDEFGAAVSGVGDINGDGHDDFLVGAPGRDAGGNNAGRLYLFLGASTPSGVSVKTWDGDCPAARLGAAVDGGFDFDDDGRPDFVVGAPGHNCTGSSAGQVRIYHGTSSGYAAELFRFHGSPNWTLGADVRGVDDFNGDGYDDVAAGGPQPNDANSGRVTVWFGQALAQPPPSSLVLEGETGMDRFGTSVAGAGDINRDGLDDIVVGAPGVGSNNGAVYLFFGSVTPDAVHDWRATGSTGNRRLGTRVDGGLDVNGDGHDDFAAGEPGANTLGTSAGGARVWFGKPSPTPSADLVLQPVSPRPTFEAGDGYGSALAFVGSFDGDGTSEILVGAPAGDADAGPAGYVNFVYDPDQLVPVTLLFLQAAAAPGETVVRWDLVDDGGLAGLRIEALRDTWSAVHEGWLPPGTRTLRTPVVDARRFRLTALDRAGTVTVLGGADAPAGAARVLGAHPFRGELRFAVPHDGGPLRVDVLDVSGRRIRSLDAGSPQPGTVPVTWDGLDASGRPAAPGVYFLRPAGSGSSPLKVVRIL